MALTKQSRLQAILTEFSMEVGLPTLKNGKVDKVRYNKAWHRLWCRLHKMKLFPDGA